MLDEIFRMQRLFNNQVIGFDILSISPEPERIKWLRNYLTAYDQELKELVECLDLRWLATRTRGGGVAGLDLDNIKVEIVDMLHFLVSMFQVLGESKVHPSHLAGKPESLAALFEALRKDFRKEFGEDPAGATPAEINRKLVLLACRDFVALGALLDCTAWKWWARQSVRWDEVKRILYREIFPQWCLMALAAGMSAADVEELYFKKNRLNFERQQKGYGRGTYSKIDDQGREDNRKLFK